MLRAIAVQIVYDYVKEHAEKDNDAFLPCDVYFVWVTEAPDYWRALFNTALNDGMYYQVRFDSDLAYAHISAYKLTDFQTVKFELVSEKVPQMKFIQR